MPIGNACLAALRARAGPANLWHDTYFFAALTGAYNDIADDLPQHE